MSRTIEKQSDAPNVILEALEDRIAPATATAIQYFSAPVGSDLLLTAGQGISTGGDSGSLLLYVEKGQALIFTTDLNGNNQLDPNEITGISAGDGLKLTSFVDIHGDIVTNLNANGTLTDSTPGGERDGRLVLNSKIESITLRSVTGADVGSSSVESRLAQSSYSIYGNIYAGGGFGVYGGGLLFDSTGLAAQQAKFTGETGNDLVNQNYVPSIGGIFTGTAVSGQYFNFGITNDPNAPSVVIGTFGQLADYKPANGIAGGDIIGVGAGQFVTTPDVTDPITGEVTPGTTSFESTVKFHIGSLVAGNGGFGARGGDIANVALFGDIGAFKAIAGDGGDGTIGGRGGNIVNVSDGGSDLGYALFKTGDGGLGLTGAGGNAGTLSLGNMKLTAKTQILLGTAGDGLTAGGNGASFVNGNFKPDVDIDYSTALALTSMTRDIGQVGTPRQANFNGDAYGDLVFLSIDPQQMVVVFGSAVGFSNENTITLDSPALTADFSAGLVIADINNDGFDDIVTASNDPNTLGGLWTYIWNPNIDDFSSPIISALPSLEDYGFLRTSQPIIDLAAGDFDGDGLFDIAVLSHATEGGSGTEGYMVLYYASGVHDAVDPAPYAGSGLFFVNFGKNVTTTRDPVEIVSSPPIGQTPGKILATARTGFLLGSGGKDIIVESQFGPNSDSNVFTINTFGVTPGNNLNLIDSVAPASTTGATIDFTIIDISDNNIFDVAAVTSEFGSLLYSKVVGISGDGLGGLAFQSTTSISGTYTQYGIVGGNFSGAVGTFHDIGIYVIPSNNLGFAQIWQYSVAAGGATSLAADIVLDTPDGIDTSVIVFDAYKSTTASVAADYAYAPPAAADSDYDYITNTFDGTFVDLVDRSLALYAGDGGNSLLGNGGNGGNISTITFIIPAAYEGDILFVGGNGGGGLVNGGNGGYVTGLEVRYAEEIEVFNSHVHLLGGDGGRAITGKGGTGGYLSKFHLISGESLIGGNGGFGNIGGNGGSVLGLGSDASPDSKDSTILAIGGNGGNGITTGGHGGDVSNFFAIYLPILSGAGGFLDYRGGNGGSALAGKGGNGGSITNSSPSIIENNLAGDIHLRGGSGGNGQTGGNGGNITNFTNLPTIPETPRAITVIAGNGGNGMSGNGGIGGNLTTVKIVGTGVSLQDNQSFNRFLAGAGGSSNGGTGGNGGTISAVSTNAIGSSTALAAGAGGEGLLKGGHGGSIINIGEVNANFNESPTLSFKVLAIAGAGGDAYASTVASTAVNPQFPSALERITSFGGALGIAGNGGNINNLTQPIGVDVLTDLIAGNGGSTVNYGKSTDVKFNVGKGGSITNINLEGYAGDVRSTVPILDYTTSTLTASYADFVTQVLAADNPTTVINNQLGNVGVVVGTSGRVLGDQPSTVTLNGSVSGFAARGVMSMVAGSVDRIAKVLSVSGLDIGNIQYLGAYKNVPFAHSSATTFYYTGPNQTGVLTSDPTSGGSLMDGAIFTTQYTGPAGARVFADQ